jgi:gamma-glutamyltranspeptidase
VGTDDSGPFKIADSSYLIDGQVTTDVPSGLTNEAATFVPGQVKDTGNTTSGVTLETNRLPASAASGLVALGYTVSSGDVGSVQAVLIDQQTGKQYGGADDRREGKVIGLPQSF